MTTMNLMKRSNATFDSLFSPPWLQPPCSAGLCMPCWWPRTFPSQPPPRFTA